MRRGVLGAKNLPELSSRPGKPFRGENSLPFIWPFQISQLAPPWSESEIEYNGQSITTVEF